MKKIFKIFKNMVKTKILMILVLLLATSADAGSQTSSQPKQEQKTQEQQEREQAQDAAPNDRDLQESVQEQVQQKHAQPNDDTLQKADQGQQAQVAIQAATPYFSEGRLDRILIPNLTRHILSFLSFQDCISLILSNRTIQNRIRNAAPPLSRVSKTSETLLHAKPGTFYELYSQVMYEVPNIAALSKNTPYWQVQRMTSTVLDLKNLVKTYQSLEPEVVERLKEAQFPLAGPVQLLLHKELWPQICVLSIEVDESDYPLKLLRLFAEQENRRLTFMIKCNVAQPSDAELIRADHGPGMRALRDVKSRHRVIKTYRTFFQVMYEIEKLDLGFVRELDCVLSNKDYDECWFEQFSHLLDYECFQDLRGYHFAQSTYKYKDGKECKFNPLKMLSHLPSSIESLSLPADFLLEEVAGQIYQRWTNFILIDRLAQDLSSEGEKIVNLLKQAHNLKEFNFSSILDSPKQFYALRYLPKDILVRGKASIHNKEVVIAVLNHFSRFDSRFELSLASSPNDPNDLISQALKKHPLMKKDWRFDTVCDSKNGFTSFDEVTDLRLSWKVSEIIDEDVLSRLKDLKQLSLMIDDFKNGKMIEQFFQACHQSVPKSIRFYAKDEDLSKVACALKALPVHIETLHLSLMSWKKAALLADTFSHLQNLKEVSFDPMGLESLDPEAQKGIHEFFVSLSHLRSLLGVSFTGDTFTCSRAPSRSFQSLDVLKALPAHIEKLELNVLKWRVFGAVPKEFFALQNLRELCLSVRLDDFVPEREPILEQFVKSLRNMKSLKKLTIIYHPNNVRNEIPPAFLSENPLFGTALVGVKKVFRAYEG